MKPTVILVDSLALLFQCIDGISGKSSTASASLAVDLEGVDLCRNGKVSIVQIMCKDSEVIWIVDVTVLGRLAFEASNEEGRSLKGILEDPNIKKIFFDVRNDADALYHLFNINLKNVYDLQILELATRYAHNRPVKFVAGLQRTIEDNLCPAASWKKIKEEGVWLFSPEKGGHYEIFEQRPLDDRILAYCAQDVSLLFQLFSAMQETLRICGGADIWEGRIEVESAKRLTQAYDQVYLGKGRHCALAPLLAERRLNQRSQGILWDF